MRTLARIARLSAVGMACGLTEQRLSGSNGNSQGSPRLRGSATAERRRGVLLTNRRTLTDKLYKLPQLLRIVNTIPVNLSASLIQTPAGAVSAAGRGQPEGLCPIRCVQPLRRGAGQGREPASALGSSGPCPILLPCRWCRYATAGYPVRPARAAITAGAAVRRVPDRAGRATRSRDSGTERVPDRVAGQSSGYPGPARQPAATGPRRVPLSCRRVPIGHGAGRRAQASAGPGSASRRSPAQGRRHQRGRSGR